LQIKNTLTGSSDRVSGEMVAWINVNFKAWHEASIPFRSPPSLPKMRLVFVAFWEGVTK
jgi:hypothetical protein